MNALRIPKHLNLALYSGGATARNYRIHRRVVAMARARNPRRALKLLYMPFCTDGAGPYYGRIKRRYRSFGVAHFDLLAADQRSLVSKTAREQIFSSDIVYLAGGNTFYFLHWLKKNKLLAPLKAFAKKGGVIAGLSAGALMFTPSIELAGYPEFEADENEVALKNLKGLGLLPFEFYPHFSPHSPRLIAALRDYSRKSKHTVLASQDGDGIIVSEGKLQPVGDLWVFSKGEFSKY